jgi:hypothetical protein
VRASRKFETYDARSAVAAQSRKLIITTQLHEGLCNRRTELASTIQRQMLIVVVIEQEAGGIERPQTVGLHRTTHAETLRLPAAVGWHGETIQPKERD